MFEKVVAAPADPILGLTEEFKKILALKRLTLALVFTKTNKAKHLFLLP